MNATTPINVHDHAQKLRDTWQSRALAETTGKTQAVVLVVLANAYSNAIMTLLRVTFPGFRDINRPFFSGSATIALSGKVVCEMTGKSGLKQTVVVYDSTDDMNRDMRGIADRLKFTDAERLEFTAAVQRWVVADRRIDHLGRRKLNS
jgi:hypothetical protein